MSDISKIAWLEAVKISEHDFTVIDKRTPCQRTITKMFCTLDIEQITNTALTTMSAAIADDWSQAEVWGGPDLI
eukprot:1928375-Ditylum_brightwellii.AAC.1